MKSILQEASTIAKAIDKAWRQAGQPREFTVKVLELNEKNFLGFTKNPAVISLIYSAASVKSSTDKRSIGRRTPRKTKPMSQRPERSRSRQDRTDTSQREVVKKEQPSRTSRDTQGRSSQSTYRKQRESDRTKTTKTGSASVSESWTPELIATIESWFKDIVGIMKCSVPFSLKADNKVLTVTFDSKVVDAVEEEGMLFASFSFLLIQSLKKKYKNKFKGFRLLITSQRSS